MRKTYIGTGFYKIHANENGTKRIVVGFCEQKIAQRTAAYVSGDFVGNESYELERAQHAVGVKQLVRKQG